MNYAVYPQKIFNIIQSYSGANGHYKHIDGAPTDYPIDIAAASTFAPFFAPCEMRCVKIHGQITGVLCAANCAWFTSVQPVAFPDGTTDYLTVLFEHMNNADFGINGIKRGKVFQKYEFVGRQGLSGKTKEPILHVSAGKGEIKNAGWLKNSKNKWVLQTTSGVFRPEQLMYLDRAFTPVVENNKGVIFKDLPPQDQDNWQTGQTLRLRRHCPVYLNPNDVNPSGTSLDGKVKIINYAPEKAHPYKIAAANSEIGWVDADTLS